MLNYRFLFVYKWVTIEKNYWIIAKKWYNETNYCVGVKDVKKHTNKNSIIQAAKNSSIDHLLLSSSSKDNNKNIILHDNDEKINYAKSKVSGHTFYA